LLARASCSEPLHKDRHALQPVQSDGRGCRQR
jgi:hypothetical protein